ncbi:MAG: hypothetical protein LBT68_00020 [Spirochaetales bacterium]|nr:hypothetical protein [Spirochaetales bacterium]
MIAKSAALRQVRIYDYLGASLPTSGRDRAIRGFGPGAAVAASHPYYPSVLRRLLGRKTLAQPTG